MGCFSPCDGQLCQCVLTAQTNIRHVHDAPNLKQHQALQTSATQQHVARCKCDATLAHAWEALMSCSLCLQVPYQLVGEALAHSHCSFSWSWR